MLVINNKLKDTENEDYLGPDDRKFLDKINEELLPLKFSILFLDIKSLDKRIKYYLPIITHLLDLMRKFIINNRTSLEKLRQILMTTLALIKSLQEKKDEKSTSTINQDITPMPLSNSVNFPSFGGNNDKSRNKKSGKIISSMSIFRRIEEEGEENEDKFFVIEDASLEGVLSLNNNNSKILNNLTEAILNFQKYYILLLSQYNSINKDSQITKNEMMIFQQSTEIMIRLQEYAQQSEVPLWISSLQKIIFDININKKLSLKAANFLIDMNMSSFHHEIYNKIKDDFQNKEIDSSIIDKNVLENLVNNTRVKKNCQELLMGKLYLVLQEQSQQKNVIDLLIKIANIDQIKFLNIIKNTFNLKNFDSIQQSMKLFSDFWKLSNEYYNEMIFFKNGECIFHMIDCLDDEDPLLRHLSKSWLNQAYQQFHKILDPIFKLLLDDSIIISNDKEHILIEKEYKTSQIRKCFRRLKNIILNSPVMDFLIKTKVSEEILSLNNLDQLYTKDFKYLGLLIAHANF